MMADSSFLILVAFGAILGGVFHHAPSVVEGFRYDFLDWNDIWEDTDKDTTGFEGNVNELQVIGDPHVASNETEHENQFTYNIIGGEGYNMLLVNDPGTGLCIFGHMSRMSQGRGYYFNKVEVVVHQMNVTIDSENIYLDHHQLSFEDDHGRNLHNTFYDVIVAIEENEVKILYSTWKLEITIKRRPLGNLNVFVDTPGDRLYLNGGIVGYMSRYSEVDYDDDADKVLTLIDSKDDTNRDLIPYTVDGDFYRLDEGVLHASEIYKAMMKRFCINC